MMQNTRNREKPPHRFLLCIAPPPTPSCHSLCLLQPFFWALSMFPSLFLSITVVRKQLHRSVHRIILCWKNTSLCIWNLQEYYWQGNIQLTACLLFHLLRQVVWWDTAELAAWLLIQWELGRPRSLPLSWNESQFGLILIFLALGGMAFDLQVCPPSSFFSG